MYLRDYDELWYSQNIPTLMKLIKVSPDINDLFTYMANRNKSPVRIHKYRDNGRDDVVFVVPSADINNKTSSNLRKQISNFPSIFVESSGPDFNYAKSCNTGILEAIKEGFKWIIVCNDDIIFKDNPIKLLEFIENGEENSVMTPRNGKNEDKAYHGEEFTVFKANALLLGLTVYNSKWSFEGNKINWSYVTSYFKNFPFFLRQMKYVVGVNNTATSFRKISSQITGKFVNFADFGIFPADVLRRFQFDETFWNGSEDYDLALRLHKNKIEIRKVNFNIESIGSASLGKSGRKHVLTLLDTLYLSHKLEALIN